MKKVHKLSEELIDFIHNSASPFHAVDTMAGQLEKAGFKALNLSDEWRLTKGGKYYLSRNGSALFAFIIGSGEPEVEGFKILAAHSDSPTFRIKPDPEIDSDNHFVRLNTEVYGGPILMTWLDRPLSIAGRVSLRSNQPLWPDNRLVNFNRPLLIIPSLAIHLNRTVNEGIELNRQKEMLPILGLTKGKNLGRGMLKRMLAKELGVADEDILDYDLSLNEYNRGCIMGYDNEFISAPKLDNLAMAHASIKGLLESKPGKSTQMVAIFDNEEVGSLTKQGADSPLLRNLFERILLQLGLSGEKIQRTIYQSFMISADMAHSVHPSHTEKYDPVLHPLINRGPVIKITANQKYTSDADSIAVFVQICEKAGVPYQKFVNHSDIAGGSTLGNISSGHLDIRTVDVGNPMLAMHSVRELAGVEDHAYMIKAFSTFFNL
ncbi:MAG: M18 family aminopeptidase [Bacteroidales bacterium]|nr:M18 family aminopeptidase [Bacteroidales bacterium]